MPKEIEKEPEGFYEEIPYLRMEFSELVDVLETMNLEVDQINATSNDAEFEGLDDIKSAPARFSGQPTLFVIRRDSDEDLASAKVQFENRRTTVCAGKYRYDTFNKMNNELAKGLYEELLPFSSPLVFWNKWMIYAMNFALFVLFFAVVGFTPNGAEVTADSVYYFKLAVGLFFSIIGFYLVDHFLKKRVPINYNPRQTFWQKHGESALVGLAMSVITAMIVTYIKSP